MKPGTIYRINYQSFHETTDLQCFVDISDNDNLIDDADPVTIIDLVGSGDPCKLSVINNDENPHSVILAQQLTARFCSTTSVDMSTFVKGSDQRWGVHYYLGTDTQTIFKGFLIADDNSISEEFLFPPNVVTLTANDGLPLIKDVPLVDADDKNPSGYHKISDFLSYALRKTGLNLSLFSAFNIKGVGFVDDISIPNVTAEHFFTTEFLESKTFEKEIGISVDCQTALEIILGHEARIFQFQGAWWILRIDEVEHPTRGIYVTEFDYQGVFVKNLGEFNVVKQIGHNHDILFSAASTSVTATRANKSVRLNYNYETPLEIPCNVDFSRGTLIADTPSKKSYDIECWDELYVDGSGDHATTDLIIRLEVDYNANGQESNRYVRLYDDGKNNLIMSGPIYVGLKDKLNISVQRRMETNHSPGGQDRAVQLRLYGDDGTFWTHHGRDSGAGGNNIEWVQCTSAFNTFQQTHVFEPDDAFDDTQNIDLYDGEVAACPVGGYIKMRVYCSQLWGATEDTFIQKVSVEYIPYINGSYEKYKGQYNSTFQTPITGEYKKKIEESVFMSDSPRKIFKGALFEVSSGNYELSGLFYNAAVWPAGPPDSTNDHPYGWLQLFDVWNQFKNEMRIVQGTVQGIDLDKTFTIDGNTLPFPAHLVSKWSLTDTSAHVLNKFFILLHFDQDHLTGGWNGVFREVFDTTVNKDYSNHDFKYIT